MDEISYQQRYEQLAAFMNIAAHELRTPITAGKIYLQLLEEQLQDRVNEQEQRSLQRSAAVMQRLNDLVANMLDVSRIFTNKLSVDLAPTDLSPIIQKAISQFPSHTIHADLPDQIMVEADADRVLQVCKNIIDNATRYDGAKAQVQISMKAEGDKVHIIITDNGPGIAPEQMPDLFELKATKEKPGLGAGLFVSKAIMQLMQGDVLVSSEQGRGTRVELVFRKC